MHLTWRRLSPGELDHEFLWLSVSVGSLGLATIWFALGLPWPHCAFHDLTGLPCVTCGMTRCGIQFFQGHFPAAMRWNPLLFAALCAVSIFNTYAFAVLIARAPRLRISFGTVGERRCARIIALGAITLNWIYLLAHWQQF